MSSDSVDCYLKRTKTLQNEENKLFVAIKKPLKAVRSQTLSRWIKSVLGSSRLDTSKFSAYTRHASTSAAERSDVNIDLILKAARWTKNLKPLPDFIVALLLQITGHMHWQF